MANSHILTAAGWLPLRRLPLGSPGPYYAGDLLGSYAFTGSGWVHVPVDGAARTPSAGGMAPVAGAPSGAPTRSGGRGWLVALAIGLAMAVLIVLGVIGTILGNSDDNATSATPTPTPTPTAKPKRSPKPKPKPDPEASYTARMIKLGWAHWVQSNDSLWVKMDGSNADGFAVTWKIRVLSRTGCPNGVYLEANILDTSNTVVGFANDALPSLPANQQAVLQLSSTAKGTIHLQPTEASCY